MPTLDWIGKRKVVNHHLDVPYHVLERKFSFDGERGQDEADNGSGNMIIHGDNLVALKSLLPKYAGRIRCIYIDPPYNTGNEGWVYNDNVNDPKIRKWLGEVVGKEGEDLSRHDKWLCMMYPRLRLLQKLLSEDGAIFISIDDTEYANLKAICDEIFGANCFISNISWQRTYSTRNDSRGIVNEAEHVLCYGKHPGWNPKKLPRTGKMDERYSSPDNDSRLWKAGDASAPGASSHPGMVYAIQHPITGRLLYPPNGRCWTFGQDQMLKIMREWSDYELRHIDDYGKRVSICGQSDTVPREIDAIMLYDDSEKSALLAANRYQAGNWPLLYFTSGGKGGIACKRYLEKMEGRIVTNLWPYEETGHTDEAKKEILGIFSGKATFDTPKPTRLIERILQIASDPDSIILDSFAGSGTTAHAVLNANRADGGKRCFILIEMEDYADSITAERVRRVMRGYGSGKKSVPGTGGSFSYYELGARLFLADGSLNPEVDPGEIRRYIWYMETRAQLPAPSHAEPCLLGVYNGMAYYFLYAPGQPMALDKSFLSTVRTRADHYVIYADACLLSEEKLQRFNITFRKIPRDLPRL